MLEYSDFGSLLTGMLGSWFGSGDFMSGAINALGSYYDRQNALQDSKELMRYQADLQKQQFDYTAAYNLPKEQIKRQVDGLVANGLNPNLVYGSGWSSANASQPSVGTVSRNPQNTLDNYIALEQGFNTINLQREQIKGVELDNRNKAQDLETKKEYLRGLKWQNDFNVDTETWTKREKEALSNVLWMSQDSAELERAKSKLNLFALKDYYGFGTHESMTAEEMDMYSARREDFVKKVRAEVNLQDLSNKQIIAGIRNLLASSYAMTQKGNLDKKMKDLWDSGVNPNDPAIWKFFEKILHGTGLTPEMIGETLRDLFKGNNDRFFIVTSGQGLNYFDD